MNYLCIQCDFGTRQATSDRMCPNCKCEPLFNISTPELKQRALMLKEEIVSGDIESMDYRFLLKGGIVGMMCALVLWKFVLPPDLASFEAFAEILTWISVALILGGAYLGRIIGAHIASKKHKREVNPHNVEFQFADD